MNKTEFEEKLTAYARTLLTAPVTTARQVTGAGRVEVQVSHDPAPEERFYHGRCRLRFDVTVDERHLIDAPLLMAEELGMRVAKNVVATAAKLGSPSAEYAALRGLAMIERGRLDELYAAERELMEMRSRFGFPPKAADFPQVPPVKFERTQAGAVEVIKALPDEPTRPAGLPAAAGRVCSCDALEPPGNFELTVPDDPDARTDLTTARLLREAQDRARRRVQRSSSRWPVCRWGGAVSLTWTEARRTATLRSYVARWRCDCGDPKVVAR